MTVYFLLGLALGLIVGVVVTLIAGRLRARAVDQQTQQAFAKLAGDALDANSSRLMESAAATLEGKKALIDQTLATVGQRLDQVRDFVQRVETQRQADMSRLSSSVASLSQTTGDLHKMLASTQRRGAWGERMAEDILRLAGLQEGVNYSRQDLAQVEQGRPDFTFFLPNDLKCNMDVKFPLESYKAFVDAADDAQRQAAMRQLVMAVRGHIRAVAGRGYIDPQAPTVPYVILFVPSEQIFSLVLSAQADLIDEALKQKIVLASPLTLYAMLSVIRQAAEHTNILKTADEVITLLTQFQKQWQLYNEQLDKVGQRITQLDDEFQKLKTTRTNMLQRPLDRIEDIRQSRGLPG